MSAPKPPPAKAPPAQAPAQEKGASADAATSLPASPLMTKESGNAITNAVADIVDRTAAPFQALKKPKNAFDAIAQAQAVVADIAGLTSTSTEFLNDAFARLTSPVAKAFEMSAISVGGITLGLPHLHSHPPAMPNPLPGIGMVVTGCMSVYIGHLPAARCGDFGVGPTCGSASPIFEIFTGSSNVFIGGARAARMMDMTRQCMPASPAAGAGQALKAVSKLSKAMEAVDKISDKVGKVAMVVNAVGAVSKAIDMHRQSASAEQKAADAAAAAANGKLDAAAAAVQAQATAATAAAEANAAALAAGMMGVQLAMDQVRKALGKLMGKDPGASPCIGMLGPGHPSVQIGGFPMPSWSDVAKGLKKLLAMLGEARRGGGSQGKSSCATCT